MPDTDNMLKNHVDHIVNTLRNPPLVDEDGHEVDVLWDEETEQYIDEDGDPVDAHEMTGFDYLSDVLDIEYRVGSDKEYRSAKVMVACGGPNIWIDTGSQKVIGAWWGDYYEAPYNTDMDLDETLEELWNC